MLYLLFLIFYFSIFSQNTNRRMTHQQEARNSEERPMGVTPKNGGA
jgi:hypothetical protein